MNQNRIPAGRKGALARFTVGAVMIGMALGTAPFCEAQAPAPETPTVSLQYPNNPLSDILRDYEELTGKKIIKDVNVLGATVSIETTGMLTRTEAVEFIEKSLLLNGYAFVPSGDNFLKIISFAGGKRPRSQGDVPLISRVEDLPETDQVVTFFMPLTYITTEDAVRTFTQIIPNNTYGAIVPVPGASAIVIAESSAVIRSLAELKEFVDVPPGQVVNKSIQLERADAEEVASILTELLGAQSTSSSSSGGGATRNLALQARQGTGAPGGAAQAAVPTAAGTGGGGAEGFETQIVPIVRRNSILIIARPIDVAYIESLVAEFDAPAEVSNFLKRRLNYLRVLDFLPIANDALSRGLDQSGGGGFGSAGGRTSTTRTTASQLGQGEQSRSVSGGQGVGGTGGLTGGGSGGGGLGLSDPQDFGGPESLLVGKTLIIADSQANALLVSGPPENLRIITELLDELDLPTSQIYLSTVIGQLNIGDNFDFSVDILRTYAKEGDSVGGAGVFRGGSSDLATVLRPEEIEGVEDFGPILAGLTLYGTYGEHLTAFVRALETTNEFTVLSRPSVFVRNNVRAVIRTGERIAVPTSTLTSLDTGVATPSVQSSIEFRDVVLELEVVPLINSDSEVTLQIAQLNDNVVGTQIVSGNEVPIISTQELITEVTVPDQATIILGGLISEDYNETKSGFPFLVHVPILKHLVGGVSNQVSRSELLIFIQPQIINTQDDLVDANVDMTRRAEVSGRALDYAIPEPPVLPSEVRTDVDGDADELARAWEEEMARRRLEELREEEREKGGLFNWKGKSGNRKTSVGRKRKSY